MKRPPLFFIPAGLLALGFLAACQDVKSPKAPPAVPAPKATSAAAQPVAIDLLAMSTDRNPSF